MAIGLAGSIIRFLLYRVAVFAFSRVATEATSTSGSISFALYRLILPRDSLVHNVSLVRLNGDGGEVVASVGVSLGDFNIPNVSWELVWQDGDMSPKMINVRDLLNRYDEFDLVIRGTQHERAEADLTWAIEKIRVQACGDLAYSQGQPFIAWSCLVGFPQTRYSFNASVELFSCSASSAIEGVDFHFLPGRKESLVYQYLPGQEADPSAYTCLLRNLPAVGNSDAYGVVWLPHATFGVKSICVQVAATIIGDSPQNKMDVSEVLEIFWNESAPGPQGILPLRGNFYDQNYVQLGYVFQPSLLTCVYRWPTLFLFPSYRLIADTQSGECLVYGTQSQVTLTRASIGLQHTPCVGVDEATMGTKYEFLPANISLETWDLGTRCVLRNLGFLPNEAAGNLDSNGVILWPDALVESMKNICFRHETSGFINIGLNSSGKAARKIVCRKGTPCIINFPWTFLYPTDILFLALKDCPKSCEGKSDLNGIEFEAATLPYSMDRGIVDSYNALVPSVFCLCPKIFSNGTTRFMGELVVTGPSPTNRAMCRKGARRCSVSLDTVSPSLYSESIRILFDSCQAFEATPDAFITGARAHISTNYTSGKRAVYILDDTRAMMGAEPGIFNICWCSKSEFVSCASPDAFSTLAGDFIYEGPFSLDALIMPFGEKFVLRRVSGIGLTKLGRVRVMRECGMDDGSFFLQADCFTDSQTYDFGVLDNSYIMAGAYSLCWCQPDRESVAWMLDFAANCSRGEDFAAKFGSLTLRCPPGYENYRMEGKCKACFPWQRVNVSSGACEVDPVYFTLLVVSLLGGMVAMFVVLDQVELARSRPLKKGWNIQVRGRSISIEDICREEEGVFVTTHHLHFLRKTCGSIPVRFIGTGHRALDAAAGSSREFRAVVVGPQRLRLLDAQNCPIAQRIDSSMGVIVLRPLQACAHTAFLGLFPMLWIFLTLLALVWSARAWVYRSTADSFAQGQLGILLTCDIVLGLSLRALWRARKTRTLLQGRLDLYEQRLSAWNPNPKPCQRGATRAVTAFQLFDMYEFFQAFIRDRTMYYIDPHITRPLTAAYRLSYSERVGPKMVQWFVSHFWGTQFRDFCAAIERHAITTVRRERVVSPDSKVDESWKNACYWICTFSNNQYMVSAELGNGDHKQSSFYLALHSGVCEGTCMILDELAKPLTRSWCLFEILQTLGLKRHQEQFAGLLFCTSTGVLNYGAASVAVALNIGHRIAEMRLEDAEATSSDDKEMINSLVLAEMGSFDRINAELKGYIRSALDVCRKHVESDFITIDLELNSASHECEDIYDI